MPFQPDVYRLLPTFLAAAESQNFSAAARLLGMTPAAVSKNIRQLEQRIGTVLFIRNTHHMTLTEEGIALREQVGPLWYSLNQALIAPSTEPAGLIRVSVIPGFGRHVLLPTLNEFQRRYPKIRFDLSMDARNVNLIGERVDVAIGQRTPHDRRVIVREITPIQMIMAASPDYLSINGHPVKPIDLRQHRCLLHRNAGNGRLQSWLNDGTLVNEHSAWLIASSPDALLDAALADMGIVYLAYWYLERPIVENMLIPVLENFYPRPQSLWIKYPVERLSPRVKVFVDFLLEKFN